MNMTPQQEHDLLLFKGVVALFVEHGVQPRRLEVWKQKLQQMGGLLRTHINRTITHIFAVDVRMLEERIAPGRLRKLQAVTLKYEWLEDCLKAGQSLATESYLLASEPRSQLISLGGVSAIPQDEKGFQESSMESEQGSENRSEGEDSESDERLYKRRKTENDWMNIIHKGAKVGVVGAKGITTHGNGGNRDESQNQTATDSVSASQEQPFQLIQETGKTYTPPDLNKNIIDIFNEMKNIWGDALGDDRRSFSYYKAISVLEKVPFKITSADQVKGLPSIGRSMQDHIDEILKTGTLAKLEHFKEDEKVRAVIQFGSVWGIGPTTAQKLYEKGHRTLEDLKNEESLTPPQRLGLKFHKDINTRIARHEVQEMEALVQKVGETIQPNIIVVCGGSYRRGKAFVGDIDIVITHPDGKSHAGFLVKLVKALKDIDFLTEDLRFDPHYNIPVTERAVDTYFGLCKYPGRELRHRIDFKVYPYEKYPYGLIAWTGNDVLNRRLRILADSKGYKLDDHGCFPVMKDAHGKRVANRSCGVICKDEREVFEFVGFPWLEPHERNL